ncbi:hypothetical protein Hanom_Chr05g00425821 [Helianthus anomalus]
MSKAPPVATNGSLSKHLKVLRPSSSLVLGPLPEVTVVPIEDAIHTSPPQASIQSRIQVPSSSRAQSPLAPLFVEGCPPPYVPNWKTTSSSIISTGEIARDFMSHALPPQKFMKDVVLECCNAFRC